MEMTTTSAKTRSNNKWKAKALKRVSFEVRKEYFEEVLKPASESLRIPVNTFIKQAITEKIERDGIDLPIDLYKP